VNSSVTSAFSLVSAIAFLFLAAPCAFAAVSEDEANLLLKRFHDEFAPLAATHGARLFTELDYTATSPGAMATRSYDHKKWFIKIWGGIPKFPSATGDTYTLILCHELGHHLGGYPFYSHDANEWAAAEGQADYWATQACAKRLWRDEINVNTTFSGVKNTGCETLFVEENEVNLCKRIYRAVDINAELEGKTSKGGLPSIQRRDTSVVRELLVSHPKAQCRVDSMLMGLRCPREFDFSYIPGRGNPLGQNTLSSENQARMSSCFTADGYTHGTRPLCWFKSATLDKVPAQSLFNLPKASRLDLKDGLLPWIVD